MSTYEVEISGAWKPWPGRGTAWVYTWKVRDVAQGDTVYLFVAKMRARRAVKLARKGKIYYAPTVRRYTL